MAKITIHDINISQLCESEPLEAQHGLNFIQFVQASGQDEQWIFQLFEHDILSCPHPDPKQHAFVSQDLTRARRAYRLQRDFDASFQAVAVMLDLLDEIHDLRKQLRLK